MLRIDDFLWYIFMNNNANDNSLNTYTTTINGATLDTNADGVSNMAYSFDGVNDEITIGSSAYDALIDAVNAGVVGIHISMYNDKTANNNDLIFSASPNPTSTSFIAIGENDGTNDFVYYALGNGSLSNEINKNPYTIITGVWKNSIYETTKATYYNGRINVNGSDLALTKSSSNQLVSKSVNANRKISIGWRADQPVNRSFKGKMNNAFAIKKVINATEQSYINKFGNMKRIA